MIINRDKLLKKYKKSRLAVDLEIYKLAKTQTKKIVSSKKANFYKETIMENTGNSKKIWKTLNSLGLPSKKSNGSSICLNTNGVTTFESKTNAQIFRNFYANLASDLLKKLTSPCNIFGSDYVKNYYSKHGIKPNAFKLHEVEEEEIEEILSKFNINKAAGLDGLSGIFFRDGSSILHKPISQIINLSIRLSQVPNKTKVAKLKPLFKGGGGKIGTKVLQTSFLASPFFQDHGKGYP